MRARTLLLAVSWLTVALPAEAQVREPTVPAPMQVVASQPNVYVVSEVQVFEGDTLFLTNVDPQLPHDVVSEDYVPGTAQRVFRTQGAVGLGGHIQVVGVERLPAGDSRPFLCSLHPEMRGNVTVLARPAA